MTTTDVPVVLVVKVVLMLQIRRGHRRTPREGTMVGARNSTTEVPRSMTEESRPSASTRSFEEKYVRFRTEEGRAVSRAALGTDVANGYTTSEQAAALVHHLGVGAGHRLLDLGAGRGWPGSFIAVATGCTLVSTDLPMDALLSAQENIGALDLGASAVVLSADGRQLPFADSVFDAICHADVLC